jgi:hypothetical protein
MTLLSYGTPYTVGVNVTTMVEQTCVAQKDQGEHTLARQQMYMR